MLLLFLNRNNRGVIIQTLIMNQSPLQFNPKGAANQTKTQDLGQFEVICRVRPLQPPETASDIAVNQDKPTITITQQAKNISKEFSFHRLYKEDSTQAQFTRELADAIFDNCRINDKGSLILSYGVTNSGKTFTILGTEEEPGLLPIIVQKALRQFPNSKLKITAIEAYNDEFYSLQNKQKLLPKELYGTYQFDDYQPEEITLQSIKTMIKLYIKNRSQSDTRANKNSSRSHAIFKIDCQALSVAIVDLAGSERLNKASTNVHQTTSINTSLLVLGRCIHAFRDHNVVPFRQSKLTRALAEYFNSMYKIFMVAHINRSGEMFHENINVLEYAAVSMTVRHLNPQVNRSILKSARKKSIAAKSNIKIQSCDADNSIMKLSEIEKTGQGKKKLKKVQIEQDPLEKLIQEDLRKKKRMAMEVYISQMIAKIDDFDYYLDCQFEVQNSKDEEFLKEIRNTKYVSPSKEKTIRQSVIEAENRIRIRKEILEEIEKQKMSQRSDVATEMGPSMKKCLEESIRRRPLESKEEQFEEIEQIHDAAITPAKNDGLQEDQSLLERILSKSKTVFKSTSKAIEQVVYSLREFSKKKEIKKSIQKRKPNLSIANQQVNEMFEQKKLHCQKAESNEPNDFIRLLEKIDNASNASSDQTSFLLDSLNQSEEEKKIKVYFNHEANLKPKLVEVRESQEFNQHKNSPFFKTNSELTQEQKSKLYKIEKDSTFEESLNNSKTIEHQIGQKDRKKDIQEKSVRSVVTTENGDSKNNRKKSYNKIPQPLHFKKATADISAVSPIKTRCQRRKQGKNTRIV